MTKFIDEQTGKNEKQLKYQELPEYEEPGIPTQCWCEISTIFLEGNPEMCLLNACIVPLTE